MLEFDNKINLGTLIPLALFVAGYFVKWWLAAAAEHRQRRRFYAAIYTEVQLNTMKLERDASSVPPIQVGNALLAKKATYRPHVLSFISSDIYKSNLAMLPELPEILVKSLISFYGNLETILVITKSFENKSFETISVASRQFILALFVNHLKETAKEGSDLIKKLKDALKISDVT